MLHHKAPHRAVGAGREARAHVRRSLDSRAADAVGRYATRTDALHENQQRVAERPDAARSEARAAAGSRRAPALTSWLATKPDT